MPDKLLPVAKYFVRHPVGNGAHVRSCVHFITYGLSYGPTNVIGFPLLFDLDLSQHQPPPEDLCDKFDGLDRVLADSFFSIRANEDEYHRAVAKVKEALDQAWRLKPPGGCVACLIHCNIGRHRSVAMAERLAKKVRSWDGHKAECLHLDLRKGQKTQPKYAARAKPTDVSEHEPARERTRSRHQVQATSETQVSETRRRRAAVTPDAILPPREAPLRETKVLWVKTIPVEELYSRQRETDGRSARPWGEHETQSKRLSS